MKLSTRARYALRMMIEIARRPGTDLVSIGHVAENTNISKGYLDQLSVHVEGKKEVYDAGPEKVTEVENKIQAHIRGMIGIGVGVKMVALKTIARSEGKAQRVIDKRVKGD